MPSGGNCCFPTLTFDATAVAACPDWLRRTPRSAESGSPASAAATTLHPADRSSACAPLGADLGRIPDPQLELQVTQQTLEPARVPAGFHPHSHGYISLLEFLVKLFGLFAMTEPPFTQFTRVSVHESNLLEARMIVTTYNEHVRLLSSEPFGWFAPPKSTRAWEPTLFMESLHSQPGSECNRCNNN